MVSDNDGPLDVNLHKSRPETICQLYVSTVWFSSRDAICFSCDTIGHNRLKQQINILYPKSVTRVATVLTVVSRQTRQLQQQLWRDGHQHLHLTSHPSMTCFESLETWGPGAGIMMADERQVTTVQPSFHHQHSTNRV